MGKQTNLQMAIEIGVTKGRGYDPVNVVKFYQKDGLSSECLKYMENLNPKLAPFACPHMRVLPRDMRIMKEEGPPSRYKAGELLCLELARKSVSRRCGVKRGNIVNERGELGVLCKAELYTFKLVVPKTEP